ncbi:sigma-70 family RNA polymerase sigma factor [Candidatus Sumerlaeota bacterium]|nr:sigma-70 family RNA polymerase sigma factor [Candidatus Sumerlaeota bacterium]
MEDGLIIKSVLGGDRELFARLVERHQKMVYAITWSNLGDADLAEDAAQESFIKAFRYLGTLRQPEKFGRWLARIARNISISIKRKNHRHLQMIKRWELEKSMSTSPARESEPSLEESLRLTLTQIPERHREALTLFYMEEKSIREASEILNITEDAMKTRLHRARKALRDEMEQRLENALQNLKPGKKFSGSIMSLLPASPMGTTGFGGILFKWFAGLSFLFWISLGQIFVFGSFMTWIGRKMEGNIQDSPEHRFRKSILRRNRIIVIAMVFVVIFGSRIIAGKFGPLIIFQLGSIYLLWALWNVLRYLRLNRSLYAWGQVFTLSMMLIAFLLIGFGYAPFYLFVAVMIVINIVLYFTNKDMPRRMDYNLFLRCATGGFGEIPDEIEKNDLFISQEEMKGFSRFLGEEWLVGDYNIKDNTLTLKLPPVRLTPLNMFSGKTHGGSSIVIDSEGSCRTHIYPEDLEGIRNTMGKTISTEDLSRGVKESVSYALRLFIKGDREGASNALFSYTDGAIFKEPFYKTKAYRIMFGIAIAGGLLALFLWTIVRFINS